MRRRRPDLSVYLTPVAPCPGDALHARIRLESRSVTPYDAVDVVLTGKEARYERTDQGGDTSTSLYHQRETLRLGLRFDGGVLQPGVWEREITFDLPDDAPPSYRSPLASVVYELEVRVRIPWWPDRHARYTVTVVLAPVQTGEPRPHVYTTEVGEHRGDEPVLELSLADDRLPIGGTLDGALAVTGLGKRSLRRVEIACVAVETALVVSSAGPRDTARRTWVVHEGTPPDGASIPFRLAIPDDLPPSFRSPFIRVDHAIEAVAVVAFGQNLSLRAPVVALRSLVARRDRDAPLVGRARHLDVWREAVEHARRMGLDSIALDEQEGLATFTADGVHVVVAEEQGEGRRRKRTMSEVGPCLVAELTWPALGLELRLAERRWTDFGRDSLALDPKLARRFTVRAREPGQVAPLFQPGVSSGLLAFDEVGLDDEGAVLLRRGGVYRVAGLARFLTDVHALTVELARAAAGISPPAAFGSAGSEWRRFARERGLRLRAGDLAIEDWVVRGVPLSLTHRFEGEQPVASCLTVRLPTRVEGVAFRDALAKAMGAAGFLEGQRVGVSLPSMQQPERALPQAEAFAAAVAQLLGDEVGPYR